MRATSRDLVIIAEGTGKAVWKTRWSRLPDAAADSDLVIELVPAAGAGVAGASKMISECFGAAPDTVTQLAADDAELRVAAEKARADLVALQRRSPKGLSADQRLTVKAKFTGGDGVVEWMWVDVVAIKAGSFEGTLANDPALIDSLHHGAKVKVQLADVGDYLLEQRGGATTGGYSLEVMKRRGLIPAGP